MAPTSYGERVRLALIPTVIGLLFIGLGVSFFYPGPASCVSAAAFPPPPSSSCPSLPVNYPLASAVLGVGLVLTALGAVLLLRLLFEGRKVRLEHSRSPTSY